MPSSDFFASALVPQLMRRDVYARDEEQDYALYRPDGSAHL
jgi:hypothetical protein